MAASQFDYATMATATTEIKTAADAIADKVTSIATNANAAVGACYTGEAADSYKAAFNKVADDVSTTIKSIATALETELDLQKAAYVKKEQEMASSVASVTATN